MADEDVLDRARRSFREHSWREAHLRFAEADAGTTLSPEDLELYARASFLVGADEDCARALERAHRGWLSSQEPERAAESAFWLGFNLMQRGETARAGGWLARAAELAGDGRRTATAIHGLLLVPQALVALVQGDPDTALTLFTRAHEHGRRCGDPELSALAGLGVGQSLVALGRPDEGLARLDEVMVDVAGGEVSPIVSGIVYCAVIIVCHDTYEVRRATEWTRALSSWCESQPDLVPFRGQCLVHRAQLLLLSGAWQDATAEVRAACMRFSDPPGQPAIGMAHYEQAELHRLRGEHTAAEEAYRRASRCGHEVQPGLALLRLAEGRAEAAQAGIRRALDELRGGVAGSGGRPRLLAAHVEIALAASDVSEARRAADDLAEVAAARDTALLQAMSAEATGAVLLAEDDPRGALAALRRACARWRALAAPYQDARVRVLQGLACRALGDHDTAELELDAAAAVFRELGAKDDLDRLARLGARPDAPSGPLTAREVQVLREVATGKSNRAVAEELFLSEKTVARHVSNIFLKLDVSSRAAATAYAYEHDLV